MKIPETTQELFALVTAVIEGNQEEARKIGAVYLFDIKGEGGGTWTIDLTSDPPVCVAGKTKKPDTTIEVSNEDFKRMIATPAAGMELYFQGKLRVVGNPTAATKLHSVFGLIK